MHLVASVFKPLDIGIAFAIGASATNKLSR